MAKYTQNIEIPVGYNVWFIRNNKVDSAVVNSIEIVVSLNSDSKITTQTTYHLKNEDNFSMDLSKLFPSKEDLKNFLKSLSRKRKTYDSPSHAVSSKHSINDELYFMLNDDVMSSKITQIKYIISGTNNNKSVYDVDYVFNVDDKTVTLNENEVYDGNESLLNSIFEE